MISVKETNLYTKALKELNYSFGNVFIFDGYIISEINQGVIFNWEEHAKIIVDDVTCFLGTDGHDLIYISHRINSYSVVPHGWINFFKSRYKLKGYFIVSDDKVRILGLLIENLFFNNKIKRFNNLETAINSIKIGLLEVA
ncbi:hypothetical protein EV196_108109 [Mariniflexile fucanivorans]|uniref:Uncharacterized protein n=1 Tax=Mariniflexile fucanivorans TaxID=264023 RepID=A0A4R1RDJ7_9FLAO|nr:hypothetical protein [Mariniflexile fucanivorans]TCL63913.1 hypothetical protein EV196_108109 [Mariniflexile fucanivorans]